jgi:ankyrin repeat protein
LVGDRELVEELISDHPELMNSTIQAGSDSGITSLMIAALSGSPGLFLDLLQKDASLLRKFSDHGLTPLHFAARAGALEIVKIILEQDPKQIDLTTANQLTSLHAAARSGVLSVVQLLYVRKPDWIVKTTTDTDLSVFHAAARSGSLEVVQFVLKPSVKTSVRLKLLRMFNDDTTRVAKGYKTPFHFAIRSQSNDVLSYLANQSTCLTMINTPLVIAVEKNLHDQVEHVLQLDPEAANSNFLTIKGIGIESNLMHRAIECGHPKILEVLIHHDLKKKSDRWLKREFIDPPKMMARCDHQGKTPLELAISKGMIAFVKQLVEAEP